VLNALEPWHLIIILGVVVVLFGAKRLPGSARSLGRSMRIFRAEMAHVNDTAEVTGGHDTDEIAPIPSPAPIATPMPADVTAGGRS
jgi:sec-independent protein translocase protein TatA